MSDPNSFMQVTFPGTTPVESRTYPLPFSLDDFYTMVHRYAEWQKGMGKPLDPHDYEQDTEEDMTEIAPKIVEDTAPEQLRPFIRIVDKTNSLTELHTLFNTLRQSGFLPEQLMRVLKKKSGDEYINLLDHIQRRALTLLTEARGDISSRKDLGTFAQSVFDFPFMRLVYDKTKQSYIFERRIEQSIKDNEPEDIATETVALELVLGAFAEWIRNPRKTKTLDDARAVLTLLPEKKFYAKVREQLTSLLAERERTAQQKALKGKTRATKSSTEPSEPLDK
jgi:hypothetical protein